MTVTLRDLWDEGDMGRQTPAPAGDGAASCVPLLPLDRADGGVLVLADGSRVALLEVETVNFLWLPQDEQEALIAAFREMLNGLTFPLQMLVVVEEMDLAELARRVRERAPARLRELAEEHACFLAEMAGERRLLRRRALAVVAAAPGEGDVEERAAAVFSGLAAVGLRPRWLSGEEALEVMRAAMGVKR